jgi:hypothetical protein
LLLLRLREPDPMQAARGATPCIPGRGIAAPCIPCPVTTMQRHRPRRPLPNRRTKDDEGSALPQRRGAPTIGTLLR